MPPQLIFPAYKGTLTSEKWSKVFYNLSYRRNYVVPVGFNTFDIGTSFQVTAGTGLRVNVAEGYAMIGGHLVYESGDSVNVTANTTTYLHVEVTKDTDGRTIGVQYYQSGSIQETETRMLLASITTSSTAVTSVTDLRRTLNLGAVLYYRITTGTSTTLTFPNAKGLYIRVEALGGGGGGAGVSSTSQRGFGGAGGGYLFDDGVFVGGTSVEIQIGAGGSGGSNGNGGGGGNTLIRIRDSNNNIIHTYTAQGGFGGNIYSTSDNTNYVTYQRFNYEGIYQVTSPLPSTHWTWLTGWTTSGAYRGIFNTATISTPTYFATASPRFFSGGNGGCLIGQSTYSAQPSAIVYGASGGTANGTGTGSSGVYPAGGGGAGWNTGGAGASGEAIIDILVFM